MSVTNDMNKKGAKRLTAVTSLRWKEPTSDRSRFATQFIADYSNPKAVIPDNRKNVLIEASTGPRGNRDGHMSINPSTNRSAVFGPMRNVFLGSSEDDPANF